MRDGRDARGAQPGNGTAAPGSERSGPGRGAGCRKEALPGAGPPPPEPPAASARAGPFPPLRSPRPGSGRPPPRSRARAPRTPNRRPRPSPPAGSAEPGAAGGGRTGPPRGRGPSRSRPAPPRLRATARTGREAPPAPLGPTAEHKEPSPARPGPPPLPALRGRRQARTTPGTMERSRDGRRTWLAGGRGGGVRRARQLGAARRGRGGSWGGGGAGPSGGPAERQPWLPGPLRPRRAAPPPPAQNPAAPSARPGRRGRGAARSAQASVRPRPRCGPCRVRRFGCGSGTVCVRATGPRRCSRAALYPQGGTDPGFQAAVPPRRRDDAPAPRAAHEIQIITKHHFNHRQKAAASEIHCYSI